MGTKALRLGGYLGQEAESHLGAEPYTGGRSSRLRYQVGGVRPCQARGGAWGEGRGWREAWAQGEVPETKNRVRVNSKEGGDSLTTTQTRRQGPRRGASG